MKHILNNLSEEEKNAIREQHTGGMKIDTTKFFSLVEKKLGDVKPILNEQGVKNTGSINVPDLAIKAIQAIESKFSFMDNGKIKGGNYTGREKLGVFSDYVNQTIGADCWSNMSDKLKAQIYAFCFQADTSVPFKLKFIAGLAYAMDNSIDRSKIVNKQLNDPYVQQAIKIIKSNCSNINSYYDNYLQVLDQQYKSMDYNNNYANIWKYRPSSIDQIMNGSDTKTVLANWEKNLNVGPTQTQNSNNQPGGTNNFIKGQKYSAIRSVDPKNQYIIRIDDVIQGGRYVMGMITGPGKYDGQDMKNGVSQELSVQNGKLQGNMSMGDFSNLKLVK